MRGEVWEAHVPRAGVHPVVILTINALRDRLSSVTVAVVTGSRGPSSTNIPIGREAGLSKYPESYVNTTDIHTIASVSCRTRRGLLLRSEMAAVEESLRTSLGLHHQ
jgi:mRNA interferase MazF